MNGQPHKVAALKKEDPFEGVSLILNPTSGGAWVAQSLKRLPRGFSSGHDLTVSEIEPRARFYTDNTETAWDSLSPSLFAPPWLSRSLKINK